MHTLIAYMYSIIWLKIDAFSRSTDSPEEHPPRLIVVPEPEEEAAKSTDIPPHEFECGEIFDGLESGSFSSPDYGVYTHNTDCEWSIRVSEGYQLKMTIEIDMDYT